MFGAESFPVFLVGQGLSGPGIGIKVIVQMDSIDVIVADHFHDHPNDVFAGVGMSGIEIFGIAVVKAPIRVGIDGIGGCDAGQTVVRYGPKRIEPGMEFHVSGVTFTNHEIERVVIRLRGFALLATEILRPGSKFAGIKGIAGWSYLHHHRIQTHFLHAVQQLQKLLLLAVSTQTRGGRPIQVGQRSHPNCTKLMLRRLLLPLGPEADAQ